MSAQNDNAKDRASQRRGAKAESSKRISYGHGNVADWASVDPTKIVRAIAAISRAGGAIRFGYTRDGGAYALGIMGDGEPYTEYLRPTDDIGEYLDVLAERWGI